MVNKVEYNGNTIIDLTADTVTAADLPSGVTAHSASGEPITGTADYATTAYVDQQDAAVAAKAASDASSRDITFTASSSDISLTDSADARVQDLKIYGTEGGVGEGGLTVTATGENILQFDENLQTAEKNGITFEPRSDGGIYVHGIATGNTSFVFCSDMSKHNVTGLVNFNNCILNVNGIPEDIRNLTEVQLALRVSPWTTLARTSYQDAKITYTDENINSPKYIFIFVRNGCIIDSVIYPMIRDSKIISADYVPYHKIALSLTTALPLRRIMKTVDMGDIDWYYQTEKSPTSRASIPRFTASNIIFDAYIPSEQFGVENLKCSERYTSNLSPVFGGNIDKTICMGRGKGLFVIDNAYTDAAAFKAAVSGITLTYPSYCDEIDLAAGQAITRIDTDGETVLSEPVITPLTDAEIQAFREFRTFEGVTNITATDDPHMTVEYVKNTGNGKAVARVQDDAGKNIIKTLTYTGTGTTSHTITFPEKPTIILSMTNDVSGNSSYAISPVAYGSPCMFAVWAYLSSYNNNTLYHANLTYSEDGLSMTITGYDTGAAQNQEGAKYTIYYI